MGGRLHPNTGLAPWIQCVFNSIERYSKKWVHQNEAKTCKTNVKQGKNWKNCEKLKLLQGVYYTVPIRWSKYTTHIKNKFKVILTNQKTAA